MLQHVSGINKLCLFISTFINNNNKNLEKMDLSRNKLMGGSDIEKESLIRLEENRLEYIKNCKYLNEKNWVSSVACMNRISLSKILFYNQIINLISDIPGCIFELGVQWGALSSLLYNLTSINEPFNFRRKILGFDTFEGFPSSSISEKEHDLGWETNSLSTYENAQSLAEETLNLHQSFTALSHMRRHDFIKGDVIKTLPNWFIQNPHETVALCIFDMDLGIPTKKSLIEILKHSQKGTVLVFDEYSHPLFPEEGIAAREVLDSMNIKFQKSIYTPYTSYVVI